VDIAERLREVELEIGSRRAEHQISPTLERIAALTSVLGDPQHAFQVIHVTGTNGKTSTTRMIETLLRERGLRTGRFTSPHLVSMRERICVDGVPLSAERFVELYEEISPYVQLVDDKQPVPLSFFEVLTGMMFAAFADAPVDVAVIEVGLGGRWDATNVADGAVAVITPIALDHMQWLGDTIEAIATEKAGIIKPGATAVIAQQPVAAAEVLLEHAVQVGATVAREGFEFGVLARELAVGGQQLVLQGLRGIYGDVYLPLFGIYQASNAACALAAVEAFAGVPVTMAADDDSDSTITLGPGLSNAGLDPDLVRAGFAAASSPGRLDILRRSPTVIADAAHNPAAMAVTVAADKDVEGLLEELEPVLAEIVVTTNSSPRSMPAAELAVFARDYFGEDRVRVADRLDAALDLAVSLADESDATAAGLPGSTAVLVTGSVVTAGDAQQLLAPASAVGTSANLGYRQRKDQADSGGHAERGDRGDEGDAGERGGQEDSEDSDDPADRPKDGSRDDWEDQDDWNDAVDGYERRRDPRDLRDSPDSGENFDDFDSRGYEIQPYDSRQGYDSRGGTEPERGDLS
jgi:folylpolyglutamate synthase/dihydrofolate synthase